MRSAARRVLAVAGLTVREASRRRLVPAAAVMTAAYLLLYGLALHYAASSIMNAGGGRGMGELVGRAAAAELLYIGLFPAAFVVALAAVLAGAGAVSGEIDSGVAYGVLTRPIRRGEVVLGKFLGLGAMLSGYALVLNAAVIVLARWLISSPVTDWAPALALMAFEPLVLLALALLGSTRLPTVANGVMLVMAYGIAFVGGFVEQIGGLITNATMMRIGVVTSLLVPLDAVHRRALAYVMPNGLLFGQGGNGLGLGEAALPSVWMLLYAVGYVILAVALASRALARRDL